MSDYLRGFEDGTEFIFYLIDNYDIEQAKDAIIKLKKRKGERLRKKLKL